MRFLHLVAVFSMQRKQQINDIFCSVADLQPLQRFIMRLYGLWRHDLA